MCGIVGVYGGDSVDLHDSLKTIAHRGPDGRDIQTIPNSAIGHTRLAIIDIDGGQQPLSDHNQTRWLVCNGEIYNHEQLRLKTPDYEFKTDTDSEVMLALYDRFGTDMVQQLDGMFAFALIDGDDNILLARDPLGIKPLFYGWKGGQFFFASEIKALQHFVDRIEEFPPGHWYTPQDGFVRYYNVETETQPSSPITDLDLAKIRDTLTESVRKRLMSDVPVGVFLSGGLDSSIIAALACTEQPDMHSFSVGVVGSQDVAHARQVADFIGSQHHETIFTPEETVEAIPEVIYYLESFDPALVRSAIPNYFLARLAAQYVTVVLCGEGADELYAGYHYLKGIQGDLRQELITLTQTLYSCNLRRCDRMTMAHGLEGRVPFLDTEFIKVSFEVPNEYKIDRAQNIEKWALRKAFEGYLPDHILWRTKSQFAEGAGSFHLLAELAEAQITDREFRYESRKVHERTGYQIADKEELLCYREFHNHFGDVAMGVVQSWHGVNVP